MEIKRTAVPEKKRPIELDKRFYVPGYVITDNCPDCGVAWSQDLGEQYLSYPKLDEPNKIHGYCEACGSSWLAGEVLVRISIEIEKA
jgi:hypothetical protein